jgi:predicted O-methyltransferase YrrM
MKYSAITIAFKFLSHRLKAKKLHGVHSPFVFALAQTALQKNNDAERFALIEQQRSFLLQQNKTITVTDLGAGSRVHKSNTRAISAIAKYSLKPKHWAIALADILQYSKAQTIIELGTSLGITTAYLATANTTAEIITIEGCSNISAVAQEQFKILGIKNITSIVGNFNEVLPKVLMQKQPIYALYIDGNHTKEATLAYFNWALPYMHQDGLIIFDDIHWSAEMEEAWAIIKAHSTVTLSIDLFQIGIVYFRKQQLQKEHFKLYL